MARSPESPKERIEKIIEPIPNTTRALIIGELLRGCDKDSYIEEISETEIRITFIKNGQKTVGYLSQDGDDFYIQIPENKSFIRQNPDSKKIDMTAKGKIAGSVKRIISTAINS